MSDLPFPRVMEAMGPEERDLAEVVDEQLYALAADGSQPAAQELDARWRGPLLRFAARWVGPDEAEDVVQVIFAAILTTNARHADRGSFKAWLYQVATNKCWNHLRARRSRSFVVAVGDELADASDPDGLETAIETRDRSARIAQALAELDDLHRETLVLRYYAGMTEPEIAGVLGISRGTVSSRIHNGHEKLRKLLPAGIGVWLALLWMSGRARAHDLWRALLGRARVAAAMFAVALVVVCFSMISYREGCATRTDVSGADTSLVERGSARDGGASTGEAMGRRDSAAPESDPLPAEAEARRRALVEREPTWTSVAATRPGLTVWAVHDPLGTWPAPPEWVVSVEDRSLVMRAEPRLITILEPAVATREQRTTLSMGGLGVISVPVLVPPGHRCEMTTTCSADTEGRVAFGICEIAGTCRGTRARELVEVPPTPFYFTGLLVGNGIVVFNTYQPSLRDGVPALNAFWNTMWEPNGRRVGECEYVGAEGTHEQPIPFEPGAIAEVVCASHGESHACRAVREYLGGVPFGSAFRDYPDFPALRARPWSSRWECDPGALPPPAPVLPNHGAE